MAARVPLKVQAGVTVMPVPAAGAGLSNVPVPTKATSPLSAGSTPTRVPVMVAVVVLSYGLVVTAGEPMVRFSGSTVTLIAPGTITMLWVFVLLGLKVPEAA